MPAWNVSPCPGGGPGAGSPAPGEVGLDLKAPCRACGKRVAITVRGLYSRHGQPPGRCTATDCQKPQRWGTGYCQAHDARFRRHGDPLGGDLTRFTRTPVQRFWEKVDKNGPVPTHRPDLGPCWLWTGGHHPLGYGVIGWVVNGRYGKRRASHVSYEIAFGPLPHGKWALHRCDNPPCVNPDHLFAGTHAENMADMHAKGRGRYGKPEGSSAPA